MQNIFAVSQDNFLIVDVNIRFDMEAFGGDEGENAWRLLESSSWKSVG